MTFKNGPSSASFSFIFSLFKQKIQMLHQINVKNVHPASGAGIRTHSLLNMSSPITNVCLSETNLCPFQNFLQGDLIRRQCDRILSFLRSAEGWNTILDWIRCYVWPSKKERSKKAASKNDLDATMENFKGKFVSLSRPLPASSSFIFVLF